MAAKPTSSSSRTNHRLPRRSLSASSVKAFASLPLPTARRRSTASTELAPDLVLLDLMLPFVSGLDVCREIRLKSHVPIIMVTAKTCEVDTVVGLEVGADDYVTKPYRLRELVARMRAVLRRFDGRADDVTVDATRIRSWWAICRSIPAPRGAGCGDEIVTMPLKEFELLDLAHGERRSCAHA